MQTITTEQFRAIIQAANITIDSDLQDIVYSEDEDRPDVEFGYIWNRLRAPGIDISYHNGYEHPVGKPSLAELSEEIDLLWDVDTLEYTVVGADGDEIERNDLLDVITEESEITEIDTAILGADQYHDIGSDTDGGDTDMQTYTVERDNDLDIRFSGELIGSVASSDNNASGSYSGSTGRWTELDIYRTAGGKYVCAQRGMTRWEGERTRHSGAVCETEQDVIAFCGAGWLAKALYADADIDAVVEVD